MPLNERFRKLWKEAGYNRGHGSDAILPPPPAGTKRLYHLTSADHALSSVVFKRIKISRFSELNDPFELLGQNFNDRRVREIVRANKEQFNKEKGIVCFSEDWTDPVLWSHYAEKHTGVALGFDIDADLVEKVHYSEQRLKQKSPAGSRTLTPALIKLLVGTKYESWHYEREWRMLCDLTTAKKEGNVFFKPFQLDLKLVEVILGSLCNYSVQKFREVVNSNHTNVYTFKARLAHRSFRIIPQGSSVIRSDKK